MWYHKLDDFNDPKAFYSRWLNKGEIRDAKEKLEHGGKPERLSPIGITLSIRYTLHASNQPEDSKGEIIIKIEEL
jgi:hypothetical protein